MAASVYKINETGAVALSTSMTVPAGYVYQLVSVTLGLNKAPTTSQNLTITLNANAGHQYDVLLYSLDLSAASTTDLVWTPDEPILLEPGDAVDVAWLNTDACTYGVQITARGV